MPQPEVVTGPLAQSLMKEVVTALLEAAEVYVKSTASPFDDILLGIARKILENRSVNANAAAKVQEKLNQLAESLKVAASLNSPSA